LTYADWLRARGIRLYDVDGIPWMIYRRALIPAVVAPLFVSPPARALAVALRRSGGWLARFSTAPVTQPSPWWYVVCDAYDPARLSANVRSKVSRGMRRCQVRRLEADWLAEHGYDCYAAAFARYGGPRPSDRTRFAANARATRNGPQEYWGVFAGARLAGYCQCIVEGDHACTNVFKYDPTQLGHYSSYALVHCLATHYVVERGITLNNSTRAIAHDTNVQDFLLRLGFRRRYGHLVVVYRPWLAALVRALYPARHLVAALPDPPRAPLTGLMFQESLRRQSCLAAAGHHSARAV
jgi:hypothetical protein